MKSLWGPEFDLPDKKKTKDLVKKINTEKKITVATDTQRVVKSKKVSISDKLELITSEVHRILGVYKDTTEVLTTEEQLRSYIDSSIQNSIIAVDTETNHSLDPLTCKLMGVCLYTPERKQAYVPVSHTDLEGNRLVNQVSIDFVAEQLSRLKSNFCVFHNGKFDYEVIKCTTGVELPISWDTLIGAKLLDENEKAGLKEQYIQKIDPSIEKYSIEHLFSDIPYEYVDPELFALYAATDSWMTYKLYEWQKLEFEKPENSRLYKLFLNTEMPLVPVLASMELTGMCIDLDYADRLSKKYHKKLDDLDAKIDKELEKYTQKIIDFKNGPESSIIRTGSKTVGEQIDIPVKVTSPTQLAILFYDILKFKPPVKTKPRGTGEEEIKKIVEAVPEFELGNLILEKRVLEKVINTYIDKLVTCISPADNRLHAHFNQYGAATGRLSSSDPNLQNIPSHNNEIRMLFTAGTLYDDIEVDTDSLYLNRYKEVETPVGWKKVMNLAVGDSIVFEDGENLQITKLEKTENLIRICF